MGQRIAAHVLSTPVLVYGNVLGFATMNGHDTLLFDPRSVLNFHLKTRDVNGVVVDSHRGERGTYMEPWTGKVINSVRRGDAAEVRPDLPPVAGVWSEKDSTTVMRVMMNQSPIYKNFIL